MNLAMLSLALASFLFPAFAHSVEPEFVSVGISFAELTKKANAAIVAEYAKEAIKIREKQLFDHELEGLAVQPAKFGLEGKVQLGVGVNYVRDMGSGVPDWCEVELSRDQSRRWVVTSVGCSPRD